MIKAVAFDIGDTLILSTEGFRKTLASNIEYSFLKAKFPAVTHDAYKRAVENGKVVLDRMPSTEKYIDGMPNYILQQELGIKPSWKLAVEMSVLFSSELKKHTTLMPHAKSILQKLKKKRFVLGIISNAGYAKAIEWLEYFKIRDYFDIITISERVKGEKSGLEPFKDFLNQASGLGVGAEQILMVGNDMHEDTSAVRLGIKVAILKRTMIRSEKEIAPAYFLNDLRDILQIVEEKPLLNNYLNQSRMD